MHFRRQLACSVIATVGIVPLTLRADDPPTPTFTNVTVHDPSVVHDGATFYVFGSHMASASTADLMQWTQITTSAAFPNSLIRNQDPQTEFADALAYAGGVTTFFAPDVHKLGDSKYYFYYCACQGTSPLSALGLARADAITGPYANVGILLKSAGSTPTVSPYDVNTMPNVVDPTIFSDQTGRLWMVYGSFSGGIFILQLDPTPSSPTIGQPLLGQGYGKKLIGGNSSRIEGPYIVYSPETSFYYLFMTFGGLDAAGGYNIRVGRSLNPDGPYVDAAGNDLTNVRGNFAFDDATIAPYGVKLMGNWQFLHVSGEARSTSTGYVSPGGPSIYRDPSTGRYFLVFHTRFVGLGETHEVRVHQFYFNADGWPVVAPHRYAGETIGATDAGRIVGDYKLINHAKDITATVKTSAVITLNLDGSVTGAATGTWQLSGDHNATLVLGGTTYRGVFSRQWDEDNQIWVQTFSALSGGGVAVWGSMVAITTPPAVLTVATLAGQAGVSGSADGSGSSARFFSPADVAADSAGNLYVADTGNNSIRRITAAGVVSTVATGFNHPSGIAVDGSGNLYVADTDNNSVRKVSAAGAVTTLASGFNGPSGIAVDSAGNVYVADTLNHVVKSITPAGAVAVVAGQAGVSGSADGTGPAARFFGPQGLALDGSGNLYVADTNNDTIRRIVLASGAVTTVAGAAGSGGSADGAGTAARFLFPSGLAVGRSGNLFVADTDNHTVRQISSAAAVTTIAGTASAAGSADGTGGAARFNHPTGIAVDGSDTVYVADTDNHTVRFGFVAAAPAITTQPQSQTVTVGANVQFSVTASGRPSPTYQWNFNGAAIAGATTSTYSLAGVQAANAGNYTVTVTNGSGSVTSGQATLTVNPASPPPPTGGGGGGGGGGGSTSLWFLAALALLAAAHHGIRVTMGKAGRIRGTAFVWLLIPAAVGFAPATGLAADEDSRLAQLGKRDAFVHDPSTIVKCKDEYWLFATGMGLDSWRSRNLIHWERGPHVFTAPPAWVRDVVPDQKGHFWAPDVILQNGRYCVYYAVSKFGKRTSAIALVTNLTLDPADPAYRWTDEGIVVQTTEASDYNAIDPSAFRDNDGRLWLALGSFWSGIKLIELDPATGRRIAPDSKMYPLAWHESIEAACLYRHGDWYFLFVNWGICCRGVNSTYEVRVGRSRSVTGPYLDRQGKDLLDDGGSVFLATDRPFIGPGHVGILEDGGRSWVSVHFYDGTRKGLPTLAIRPLRWSDDGWPVAEENPLPP